MKCSAIAASLSVGLLLGMSASAAGNANYSDVVNQAWQKFKDDNSGKVADYIPALAKYSAGNYAIALATVDGKLYLAGNTGQKFPLESLTKIFTLAMVLNQYGSDEVLNKLGANATGLPFNSGLAIELRSDRLKSRGWQTAAYPLPQHRHDTVIMRILIRNGISATLMKSLAQDIRNIINRLAAIPEPDVAMA